MKRGDDMEWQLQEAKNKFSEVVDQAVKIGPQEITRHGKKAAVLLSMKDYRALIGRKGNLADFFRDSPLGEITFERNRDLPRSVDL
jgi:prevent-host-death family protein